MADRGGVALVAIALCVAALVGGCAGPAPATDGGSGASGGAALSPVETERPDAGGSASPLCGLFSPEEIAAVLGDEPEPGTVAGPLGTACQWVAREGDADILIQKARAEDWEDWEGGEGYRRIEGIGETADIVLHPFGLRAAARTADATYIVLLNPPPPSDDALVELLRAFVERGASIDPGGVGLPSEAPTESAGPAADCALTDEQVTKVVGVEMVRTASGCGWSSAEGGTGGLLEVHLDDVPTIAFPGGEGTQPVAGIGDEAYFGDFGTLFVRVGERGFSVQVLSMGDSSVDAEATARELAALVADAYR